MHNSVDQQQFDARWHKISNIWLKHPPLADFHKYFKKQWIESSFNKWAVFHTPPGYTTTNNPIESYNKSIKYYFTNRLKLNLIPAFEIFQELVYTESSAYFDYKTKIQITKTQENNAKKLEKDKFSKINQKLYHYKHNNGKISDINLENKTCACRYFLDRGTCLHLIYAAQKERVDLPGLQIFDKFSINRRRKLQRSKKDDEFNVDSDFEDDQEEKELEEINTKERVFSKEVLELPKKKGRPRKVTNALVVDKDIDKHITQNEETVRRSKRIKQNFY